MSRRTPRGPRHRPTSGPRSQPRHHPDPSTDRQTGPRSRPRHQPDPPGPRWRRFTALLAAWALVASGAGAVLTPGAAAAQPFQTGTYYQLVSQHSGLALDIDAASTDPGAPLVQWTPGSGQNQQFEFVPAGDGYYRIVARHSGMALDVFEWNPADGADIVQWTDLNGTNQQWTVVDRGGGYVSFINRFSGKAMDLWAFATEPGARISQYDSHGGANQQWQLVPVGGGPAPGDCGAGTGDAEVTGGGSSWTAVNGSSTVYNGPSMVGAMNAAVGSLTPGRSGQERVVVRDSGNIPVGTTVDLPSNTVFESCGTINVTGNPPPGWEYTGDNAVVRARNATNVSVPHLSVTGNPWFGVFFRDVSSVHLGQIDLRFGGSGHGVRIDNHGPAFNRTTRVTDVTIDFVHVEGTDNHGVETYGLDGLTIGTVVARDTGFAGLLLNETINASVGLVDGVGAGTGTGYAAFRVANRNGRLPNGSYATNVFVDEVRAVGGGRGIFCVSESGAMVINRIHVENVGTFPAVFIEDCYNVTMAAESGTMIGPGDVRITARPNQFLPYSDQITIENLQVINSAVNETACGGDNTVRNNAFIGSTMSVCSGSDGGGNTFS